MAQPLFNNKAGYLLTDDEVATLFQQLAVRYEMIDNAMKLIQYTEINELTLDETKNLKVKDIVDLVRDCVDFLARETERLKVASKIRLTVSKDK